MLPQWRRLSRALVALALALIGAIGVGPNPSGASGNTPSSVYTWGNDWYGQLGVGTSTFQPTPQEVPLPVGVSAVQVASGGNSSLALGANGVVYGWGYEGNWALGSGPFNDAGCLSPYGPCTSPVAISLPGGVQATSIAADSTNGFAIGTDGNLYAWGQGSSGQLGDGSLATAYSPVEVQMPPSVAPVSVLAGHGTTLVVGSDGNLYAFGRNYNGELGDGSTTDTSAPVQVGLPTGFSLTNVVVGYQDAYALGTDGSVYAWGYDQPGNGAPNGPVTTPTQVNLPVSATSIGALGNYAYAIGSDGNVYTWSFVGDGDQTITVVPGAGAAGPVAIDGASIIGVGGALYSLSPVGLAGPPESAAGPYSLALPVGVTALAISSNGASTGVASFALGSDGNVYGWGDDAYGDMGNGTSGAGNPLPQAVTLPGGQIATAVSGGNNSEFALAADGTLYSWGDNSSGELGDGSWTSESTTPQTVQLPTGVHAMTVAASGASAFAIGSDGNLYAWGNDNFGALGVSDPSGLAQCTPPSQNSVACTNIPVRVNLPVGVSPVSIASGGYGGYALGSDGVVYGWGWNSTGQLGQPFAPTNAPEYDTPIPITMPNGETPQSIAAGWENLFVTMTDGSVYVWGYNSSGEFGNGQVGAGSYTGILVSLPAGVTATQLAASGRSAFVIGSDGNLYAWGDNSYDVLGIGSSESSASLPTLVTFPAGVTAQSVATSSLDGYAVGSDGNAYAWGFNNDGQIGNGSSGGSISSPVKVSLPDGVTVLSVGADGADSGVGLAIGANLLPQKIVFSNNAPTNATVGGPAYSVAASGGGSGKPVVFNSATPSVCTVDVALVSFVGVGTCVVDANQAGSATYDAAPTASQSFTVSKGTQSISFTSTSTGPVYLGHYSVTAAGGASGNPVLFSSATSSVCTVTASLVTFIGVGTCTLHADQMGNSNWQPAPEVSQSFTVNRASAVVSWAAPGAITNGTRLSSKQLDAIANVPGVFAYSPRAGTILGAGSQILYVSFVPTDARHYTPSNATVTLQVDERPAFTSAQAVSFSAGAPAVFTVTTVGWPSPSITETGLLPPGITFTSTGNGTARFSGTPTLSAKGKSYVIQLTGQNALGTATQRLQIHVR